MINLIVFDIYDNLAGTYNISSSNQSNDIMINL